MAIDVRTEILIDRPRGEVAAFVCDPDTAPAWYANIESVGWQTPKPVAVGVEGGLCSPLPRPSPVLRR